MSDAWGLWGWLRRQVRGGVPPEVRRRGTRACRYCGARIRFVERLGRWYPVELDGRAHVHRREG